MEPLADSDMRIGAMVRSMSQDIKENYKRHIYDLYADEQGNCEGYRAICAKWHWDLIVSGYNMDKIDKYIVIIQKAFAKKIDLDKNETWRILMRILLPSQFIKKVRAEFTQIPMLAMMDPSDYDTKKSKESYSDFSKADF